MSFKEYFDKMVTDNKDYACANTFDKIKKFVGDGELILYGAGANTEFSIFLCKNEGLKVDFLCDKFKTGIHEKTGIPIISREELIKNHSKSCLIVTSWKYEEEISEELISMGFPKENMFPLRLRSRISLEEFKKVHYDGYEWAYSFLKDDLSKKTLSNLMASFIYSVPLKTNTESQRYYEKGIVSFGKDEVFLDAGAFNGDSVLEFCKNTDGVYKKIYSFEADKNQFEITKKAVSKCHDVEVINKALWNENTELYFYKRIFDESSCVFKNQSSSKVKVDTITIDSYLKDKKELPTFMKFDIEGAENEALTGAVETIKANKPKLAVSAYHKPEDIYNIIKTIQSIRSDYKFYMRQYEHGYYDTILYAI